ncbi:putative amino acid transporter [Aspergillus taichungensis]|uniref:Putative amino acid transporter n=1 Tax=Aspergillus taichungensis TaxID=482145 RepID=A0A2J5I751_9EURO|nr:putative amino acid transporter [Aspergillus taichungensis]
MATYLTTDDSSADGDKNASTTAWTAVEGDYGAESDLHRKLSTRHLTMIALGSSIGMGLWLGSGTSLANGGPAAIFIGYVLSGTMVWSVAHSIGEMAVLYPLPSAFVQWSSIFVSPAVGFTIGWAYWFNYWITIANELQGVVTVLSFWTDKVPTAAWISIFWVVIVLINIWAVSFFGEVEVVSSLIKFSWIFVVIISLIVVSAGGAPQGDPIGFRYWNAEPFTHGFKGFLSVLPTCIFAMAGSEYCALVATETKNPRKAVPRAVGSIWLRLSLFYIVGSLMITITVDPHDANLFGGSGVNGSPFVIAYRNAGLEPLAHMMNAVIFISVISSASIQAYGGSRTLMGLAHLKMAPKIFAKADGVGRPVAGLAATLIVGGGLSYLNVSQKGSDVFTWFSNLVSLLTLFGWGSICLSHLRMRYAWKVQGRTPSDLPWKTWTYPFAAAWGLFWCVLLIIIEFYLSVWPLGGDPSAKGFFANYVSVVAVLVIFVGAQIYYRGPLWIDAATIDLDRHRRFYVAPGEEEGEKSGVAKYVSKVVGAVTN